MPRGRDASELPKAIRERVHEVRSRLRWNAFWRGFFATVSVAVVALFLLAAVDAVFVLLHPAIRLSIWAVAVGVVLYVFVTRLVLPVLRQRSEMELARLLEERLPELEERLSTVVSLKRRKDGPKGDPFLKALSGIASREARDVKPKREFKLRGIGLTAGVAAGGAALVALGFALAPDLSRRVLTRAGNPLSRSANIFAGGLEVRPGDVTIAEGQALTIELEAPAGGEDRVEFLRWEDGESQTVERMMRSQSPSANGRPMYRIAFPAVSKPFSYRIRRGRGLTARHLVEVIARPRIENVKVSYRYPPYTGLAGRSETGKSVPIRAVEGTEAEVSVTISRPVKDATLYINEAPVWAHSRTGDPRHPVLTWKVSLAGDMSGKWRVELSDAQGIRNEPVHHEIDIVADAPPEIVLHSPSESELEARPDEIVPLAFTASDDLGLDRAWLVARSGEEVLSEKRIGDLLENEQEWDGQTELKLEEIAAKNVGEFELMVRVADLRTDDFGGAQIAESRAVKIRLSGGADSLLAQTLAAQRERFARELWTALDHLSSAEKLAAPLPALFVREKPVNQDVMKEIGDHCTESESQIVATAEAMATTIFSKQGAFLQSIASEDVAGARLSASMTTLSDRSREKAHQSRKTVRQLEIAISRLQQVLREFQQESARAGLVAKLDELTAKQEELADLISDPKNMSILPDLQEAQAALATEIGDLLARGSQSAAEQAAEAGKTASELAKQAQELHELQSKAASLMEDAVDPSLREQVTVELFILLEREQRELATASSWMASGLPRFAKELLFASENGETAADYLRENKVEDASRTALANVVIFEELVARDNAAPGSDLAHLYRWQDSIARQLGALAAGDVEAALQALQEQLAERAGELVARSDMLQPVAMQMAAMDATRGIGGGLEELQRAAAAAAAAGAQLGGSMPANFSFSSLPGNLAPSIDRPPSAPPTPTLAGGGSARAPGSGMTIFRTADSAAGASELPPDLAALQGTYESPFSIGETVMDSLPPALNDGDITILGGKYPPDYDPDSGQPAGGVARSTTARTTGQSSSLGAASGSASAAGTGFGNAAGSLASAAESLANVQVPSSDMFVSEEVREAFEDVMEAELPAQAAMAADEATKELQKIVTAMETGKASGGWASLAGEIDSELTAAGGSRVDPEYRDLVKQYFEAIARQSNAN